MFKIHQFSDEKHEADDNAPPLTSLRVYVQNVPVHAGTTRTCVSTCARGAGIHGDVLNVHTGTFSACPTTPHRTHHNTRHNTQDTTTTTHEDRERRERERQRKKTETEREEKRR